MMTLQVFRMLLWKWLNTWVTWKLFQKCIFQLILRIDISSTSSKLFWSKCYRTLSIKSQLWLRSRCDTIQYVAVYHINDGRGPQSRLWIRQSCAAFIISILVSLNIVKTVVVHITVVYAWPSVTNCGNFRKRWMLSFPRGGRCNTSRAYLQDVKPLGNDIAVHKCITVLSLTLIPAWIRNYIHYNVWDEITYPFLKSLGMDKLCHPTLYRIYAYLAMLWLKLKHVRKSTTGINMGPLRMPGWDYTA